MDVVGRHGGTCRPPRVPLLDDVAQVVREHTEKLAAAGYR
jgi:4-hydroxy-tetrahydrodipicolinate synthase